ncbi:rRNA-processing protein las1 [Apophysomyces ossiformis]|uniref:rRNA-processing protein las1 n=1 Tax=Apophysomyces ossiformis TaxID=679940 RepID=A0A8H7BZ63_9FUNG|nr:rRNA-processing protein las1 [Apophysomyces ossiformis]
MRLPRVVPWTGHQEFEQVYQWLYADIAESPHLVQLGIDRIKAWESRGKVPRAVESTVAFAQIRLRDRMGLGGPWLSQQELRLMYAMAFVRFVNGMVDPEQEGAFAVSVGSIAERLGLPLWFVELRHAGTHEHLPSLAVLRDGSEQAMDWLHEFYWSQVLKPEGASVFDVKTIDNIRLLLSNYKEARKAYIKESKSRPSASSARFNGALQRLIQELSQDIIKEAIIPLILNIGGMVPTGKKKRASQENMSISEDLIQLWKPLLETFANAFPGFGNDLITAMLERIDSANALFKLQPKQDFADDQTKSASYLLTIKQANIPDTDMVKELNELREQLNQVKKKGATSTDAECMRSQELSAWTIHDVSSWTSSPIGCLPDRKFPILDLTIEPENTQL